MAQVYSMHHDIDVATVMNSTTISTATTTYTSWVDTAGYEALEFLFASEAIGNGTFTATLQEADASDQSDAATVSSELILGAFVFDNTDDNSTKRVGSLSKKRYVRAGLISAGTTVAGTFTGIRILGTPHHSPTDDD